jgi:hypothetical protein
MIRRKSNALVGINIRLLTLRIFLSCLVVNVATVAASASASSSASVGLTPEKTVAATAIAASLKSSASATLNSLFSRNSHSHHLGEFFEDALERQSEFTQSAAPSAQHKHREFIRKSWCPDGVGRTNARRPTASRTTDTDITNPYSLWFYMRVGLAGGLAGASGTALLYPMDCAKTLRQSQPQTYKTVRHALADLCVTVTKTSASAAGGAAASTASPQYAWHIQRAYAGWLPAVVGAIPSSALYFGAYESMKRFITRQTTAVSTTSTSSSTLSTHSNSDQTVVSNRWHRLGIHATAAASGNILSSLVFVPKELVKQQMQYQGSGSNFLAAVLRILKTSGVPGLYCGYKTTLMRNIPSAMLRFVLYEELKYAWYTNANTAGSPDNNNMPGEHEPPLAFSWKLFAAGACAGALASGIMTPVDVLKTRVSTGTCPIDVGSCVQHILNEQGWKGMYVGAGSRMVWSGAFSAIGFGSFEAAKNFLGVSDTATAATAAPTGIIRDKASPRIVECARISTRYQRRLEHALSDVYEDETRRKRKPSNRAPGYRRAIKGD